MNVDKKEMIMLAKAMPREFVLDMLEMAIKDFKKEPSKENKSFLLANLSQAMIKLQFEDKSFEELEKAIDEIEYSNMQRKIKSN